MDQDLAQGPIGEVGSYSVSFVGGKLVASANVSLPPGESLSSVLSIDANKVIDALKAAIPGKLDDLVFELIKKALGL